MFDYLSAVLFLSQIDLLLQYLKEDPRKAVKKLAIQDLKLLAKKAPHMWSRKNMQVRTFPHEECTWFQTTRADTPACCLAYAEVFWTVVCPQILTLRVCEVQQKQ